jgi:hypothetical protein
MGKERDEIVVRHAQRWGRNRPSPNDDADTKATKAEAQRTSARIIRHVNEVENREYPQQGGRRQ